MRRVLVMSFVVAAMLIPRAALAAPHSFDGSCHITGVVRFESYQSQLLTFTGSGTCTGLLDGEMVQESPVSTRTAGEARAFLVPVLGGGAGTLTFDDAKFSFPIAYQQVASVLRIYPACMGCAGVAFGPIDSFTPEQPEPRADGPRTMIRIVVHTARTFTTP